MRHLHFETSEGWIFQWVIDRASAGNDLLKQGCQRFPLPSATFAEVWGLRRLCVALKRISTFLCYLLESVSYGCFYKWIEAACCSSSLVLSTKPQDIHREEQQAWATTCVDSSVPANCPYSSQLMVEPVGGTGLYSGHPTPNVLLLLMWERWHCGPERLSMRVGKTLARCVAGRQLICLWCGVIIDS